MNLFNDVRDAVARVCDFNLHRDQAVNTQRSASTMPTFSDSSSGHVAEARLNAHKVDNVARLSCRRSPHHRLR